MSTFTHLSTFLTLIDQACRAGARLLSACELIGLAARTVQRWMALALFVGADQAAAMPGD